MNVSRDSQGLGAGETDQVRSSTAGALNDADPSGAGDPVGKPASAGVRPETVAIRSGRSHLGSALSPALHTSMSFVLPSLDEGRRRALSTTSTEFYGRYGNPTVAAFEEAIAEMEGAEAARAYASGMGAVAGVVLGICSKGDHIVSQRQIYSGSQMLFQAVCPRFGIDVTLVDGADPEAWRGAVVPGRTTLLFAETPANPGLTLVDLAALAAIKGPVKVVDSTFATPVATRPLEWGIDLVVHSATKMIAGHNDASLGVVAGSRELVDWLWGFAVLQGANACPFDAFNGLRGLRTLPVRFAQQSATAAVLADHLADHELVENVRYPGRPDFPQLELAKAQLAASGGLLTFDIVGDIEIARRFVESTRIAQLATSLGGPETLVTHPASTTHVGLTSDELASGGITDRTIRVSTGLEHVDDLLADFKAALDKARSSEHR